MNYNDLLVYLKTRIDKINSITEKKLKVNEEIQKIVLYGLNQNNIKGLYFLGGTNLRLCYNLDRYSEDLDFSYHGKNKLDVGDINKSISGVFENIGINLELKWNTNTNVYKSFVAIGGIYKDLGISNLASEKVSVKVEIDINPPEKYKTGNNLLKSFMGTYVLQNYDITTTFAGKIGALLLRPYSKGRDYYDSMWYFENIGQKFNLEFLQEVIKQDNLISKKNTKIPKDHKEAMNMILEKVENTDINSLGEDILRFTNYGNNEIKVYLDNYKENYI